ncbi:hypothetical protein DELTA_88 [Brevundimonas phage vB_BsubS-Delta]|nr:hypothetical protein DELTA_88 [Brevundimonas phage vB_BsubS-Delta]
MTAKVTSFSGPWRWLSNFYPCVCVYEGDVYPSSEHAYQAAKFPKGHEARKTIAAMPTPGGTKKFAKTFKHAQSKDFHERKQQVMLDVLRSKFLMNRDLQDKLLATCNPEVELIEGNTWGDCYWGVCGGHGENHLGKLLMRVRGGLFLWQMAGIYPGDVTGELNAEACKLLGLPAPEPVEITVTFTRPHWDTPAADMTVEEIDSAIKLVGDEYDALVNDPEFEGRGGSPLERFSERLDELETAKKRKETV